MNLTQALHLVRQAGRGSLKDLAALLEALVRGTARVSPAVVSVTTATLTIDPAVHDGKTMVLDRAAGVTVTLPAAIGGGARYRFFVATTVTSNSDKIQVANANDIMAGIAIQSQDAGATVQAWEAGATDDTITLNGTTTGGIKGDWIEVEDVKANLWSVRAVLAATGTEATPFSAAV